MAPKKTRIKRLKNYAKVFLPDGTATLIDFCDLMWLRIFPSWQKSKGYVRAERWVRTEYGSVAQSIYLHRLIVLGKKQAACPFQVDHINRNGLDNRRSNLRLATGSQNSANSIKKTRSRSGYRGVCNAGKHRNLKKPWVVHIGSQSSGTRKCIGYFKTKEEAAAAYDAAAVNLWGRFAILNFSNKKAGNGKHIKNSTSSEIYSKPPNCN